MRHTILFMPLMALLLASCGGGTTATSPAQDSLSPSAVAQDKPAVALGSAPADQAAATSTQQAGFTGSFTSHKGVMKDISCYCFNAGTVTTDDGKEISVCFPNDDEQVDCKRIHVQGEWMNVKVEPAEGPCPGGSMDLYQVKSWQCE